MTCNSTFFSFNPSDANPNTSKTSIIFFAFSSVGLIKISISPVNLG